MTQHARTVPRPGLTAPRLREARIARGFTTAKLAEAAGLSRVAVSRYETGGIPPTGKALARLAEALRVPLAYFEAGAAPAADEPIRYSARTAATKRERDSLRVRLGWLRAIFAYLLERLELRPPKLPDLDLGDHPDAIGDRHIDEAAEALRSAWGMKDGPIPNLTAHAEANGLVVSCFAFNTEQLGSLSQWTGGRGFILLAGEAPLARQRLNLARELGHLVLHRAVTAAASAEHKLMKQQAHRFAASFLFPESAFVDEVLSVDMEALKALKQRWGLSMQAILYRARELRLIGLNTYKRHQRQLSRLGYRRQEPLDDTALTETPQHLRRCFSALIERGGYTPGDILHQLALPEQDVVQLAGLPLDFFTEGPAPSTPQPRAKVIQLRGADFGHG